MSLSCPSQGARDVFQDSHIVITRLFRHNYRLGAAQCNYWLFRGTGLDWAVRGYDSIDSGNIFIVYSSNLTDMDEYDMTREYLQCRFYIQFNLG